MTKNINIFFLISILLLSSCVFEKGSTVVDLPRASKSGSTNSIISISNVRIINNQLVINGSGLVNVTNVKVSDNLLDEAFVIESQSSNQIIANSLRNFAFDISKVFNLILSNAHAASIFTIDFSLCNSTLNTKGFDCLITPNDKDVLSYDAIAGKWKPRAINGISYQGAWDATTPEPVGVSAGDYYIVSVAGAGYGVGDWAVWNGVSYDKIDNTTSIISVFGRTGSIVATEGDYDLNKLLDVDLTIAPIAGKVLKYDGSKWIAGDDLSGGGAGSVTSTEIAAGAVTDAKIATVSASKITGTINSAQITDDTIVNADINASAAIDYSKLNIPNGSIPYAKLNIANGDIPAAKISGLPAATDILTTSIADGDTTHAPDGNVIYDSLLLKLGLDGGLLNIGATITGLPALAMSGSEATSKDYVDSRDALNVSKAGDTMSGDLNINANVKLRGTTNYVTIGADSGTSTYSLTLPASAGTLNQVLTTNGSGVLSWTSPSTTAAPSGSAGGELSGTYPNPSIASGLVVTKLATGAIDNTEFNYLDGVTSSIQAQLDGRQTLDATLTSLSAFNTNGILVQTAADTFMGRSIVGTASRTTVSNNDGVAGNPTIDISTTLLPSPAAGDIGKFLQATSTDTSVWSFLTSGDITTALGFTPLNKAGDIMTSGTIALSGTAAITVQDPVNLLDVANKQYVDGFGQWLKGTAAHAGDIYNLSGDVGIGTSTPLANAPWAAPGLEISGNRGTLQIETTNASGIATFRMKGPDANFLDDWHINMIAGPNSRMNFSPVQGSIIGLVLANDGKVGIGTPTPAYTLDVVTTAAGTVPMSLRATSATSWSAIRFLDTAGTNMASIGYGNTSASTYPGQFYLRTSSTSTPFVLATGAVERLRVDGSTGNVGIGTIFPRSTLDVNGAIIGKPAGVNTTSTINFANGNFQYTMASCGVFDLHNMKDGGTYTFVVKGTTSSTCSFSAYSDSGSTALNFHFPPDNGATMNGKHTVYTYIVVGDDVYSSWVSGV